MYFIHCIIYIKNESCNSYLPNKEQKQCFQLFLDRTLIVCALFARPNGCASETALPKNEIRFVQVCCLHPTLFLKLCKEFFSISWWSYTNQTKKIQSITLLKGAVMGYFLPISAYCYSFMFFYFLTTSTFSYPIWHRCSCYTLTVTKLKPIMKFSNLGCSGGHFGYVSLFLFLRKIQLFNIFSLGCSPYQKKYLQYVLL